jgi:microcystin-dependent protein
MAYIVNNTRGNIVAVVQDGTINTTATSLALVGRNVSPYGQINLENLVKQLENFTNDTPPDAPQQGQLWYDLPNTSLKVWTGVTWKTVSGLTRSGGAPTQSVVAGDLWYNPNNNQLQIWTGTAWSDTYSVPFLTTAPPVTANGEFYYNTVSQTLYVSDLGQNKWRLIGPPGVENFLITRWESVKVVDTGSTEHAIMIGYVNGEAVAIMAKENFRLATINPIPGFLDIVKGMTMSNTAVVAGDLQGRADRASQAAALNPGATINGVLFTGAAPIEVPIAGVVPVSQGGTGITAYFPGQLLIGSNGNLVANTLTGAGGITITNGPGSIEIGYTGTANIEGGAGISVVYSGQSGIINNTGVTSISADAGSGISLNSTTGAVQITNSGIRGITAGAGINVSTVNGTTTVTNSGIRDIQGVGNVTVSVVDGVAFISSTGGGGGSADIAGSIKLWAGSTEPSDWFFCDGRALSRSTYSVLFSRIGTTYGAGDGSTTFNIPDFRGRFGMGSSALFPRGSTGGSADAVVISHTHTGNTDIAGLHTHTGNSSSAGTHFHTGNTANSGSHTHGVTDPGHGHILTTIKRDQFDFTGGNRGYGQDTPTGNGENVAINPNFTGISINTTGSTHVHTLTTDDAGNHNHVMALNDAGSHQHSFTTSSAGQAGTNLNLPPYLSTPYIIKVNDSGGGGGDGTVYVRDILAGSGIGVSKTSDNVFTISNTAGGSGGNYLLGSGVAGQIALYGSSAPPLGWSVCNGQAVSRTAFATLFSRIGITFGPGDGINTFNLPNFNNRFAIGAGSDYNPGQTGGYQDAAIVSHTHSLGQITTKTEASGLHIHTINDSGHRHNLDDRILTEAVPGPGYGGKTPQDASGPPPATNTATTGITINSAGAHQHDLTLSGNVSTVGESAIKRNLPPFLAATYIIKMNDDIVTTVTGGTGISVNTLGNVVTVVNTGVTNLSAGSGITLSNATGSITISSSADTITAAPGSGITIDSTATSKSLSANVKSIIQGSGVSVVNNNGDITISANLFSTTSSLFNQNQGQTSINLDVPAGTWVVYATFFNHEAAFAAQTLIIDGTTVYSAPNDGDPPGTSFRPMNGIKEVTGPKTVVCSVTGVANEIGSGANSRRFVVTADRKDTIVSNVTTTTPPTTTTPGQVVRVYAAQNTAATGGQFTKVNYNTVNFDAGNYWDAANRRFNPKAAGYYRLTAVVSTTFNGSTSAVSTVSAAIRKNGATEPTARTDEFIPINAAAPLVQTMTVSDVVYFNGSTDFAEIWYAYNGGASGTQNTTFYTYLTAEACGVSNGAISEYYESPQTVRTQNILHLEYNHNLGKKPKIVEAIAVCVIPELGYNVGDEIHCMNDYSPGYYYIQPSGDATKVYLNMAGNWLVANKSTPGGGGTIAKLPNWAWKIRAFA